MLLFQKECYIANKIATKVNKYGTDIITYSKPKRYFINYTGVSGYVDIQLYGNQIGNVIRAYVDISLLGKIKVGDVAYLIDGDCLDIKELAQNDNQFCKNANYRVNSILVQNLKMKVDFKKK